MLIALSNLLPYNDCQFHFILAFSCLEICLSIYFTNKCCKYNLDHKEYPIRMLYIEIVLPCGLSDMYTYIIKATQDLLTARPFRSSITLEQLDSHAHDRLTQYLIFPIPELILCTSLNSLYRPFPFIVGTDQLDKLDGIQPTITRHD